MLTVGRCALRPMAEDDLEMVLQWRNSDRVRPYMFTTHEISPSEHRAWWLRVKSDPTRRHYVLEVDGRPVGVVNVVSISEEDGTAHWGYYIGAEDTLPGTGTVGQYLALQEIFGTLRVRKVWCEVLASNERALRLYQRFGFEREGVFRAHKFRDGCYEDVIRLALFADDWARSAERIRSSLLGA